MVGEHLRTAIDVDGFTITFAKLEEDGWRVNVEFTEKGDPVNSRGSALFKVHANTGEVTEFQKGRTWTF